VLTVLKLTCTATIIKTESKLMDSSVTLLFLYAIPVYSVHEVAQDVAWWAVGMGGTTDTPATSQN
jgi:hypothetical protein